MEVTIHNISAAKDLFDSILPQAVVCSIDAEFTGISAGLLIIFFVQFFTYYLQSSSFGLF